MDKTPTPTTFVYGPQAPSCSTDSGVLSSAEPSWPPAGTVPCSRPAHADISRHSSDDREAVSTMMFGDRFTTSLLRQDRRYQNTYEDRPFELQQRLPQLVQASNTPLHDEHLRQDQLHAECRAHHTAAAVSPTVTVCRSTASTVPQLPHASARRISPDLAPCRSRIPQRVVPQSPDLAPCQSRTLRRAAPPLQDLVVGQSRIPLPAALPRPDLAPCRSRTSDACSQTPPARYRQHDERPSHPHRIQHCEQPIYHSAAGGRGSSVDPPVGPVEIHASDGGYEASAFYRNATFHPGAPGYAPSPLILTDLPIEPFDGDIRRYPMFRNRFLDVVEDQPDLSPRHKLQYLLQFLRGEPYQLANNFQLSDVNYFIVIDRLEEQYGDQYRLRQSLAQEFIAIRPPTGGVADLRRFHDEAFRVTTELRTLGEDTEATVLFEQTLMGKLPIKLKEEIVRNSEYCRKKTVASILDGLREYARVLDEVSNSGMRFEPPAPEAATAPCRNRRHSPPARSPSVSSSEESTECSEDARAEQPTSCVSKAVVTSAIRRTEDRWRCQLCGQPHVADNCTTYITVNQRLRRAQKLCLCLHCLSEGHRADSCPWKGTDLCRICQNGNHHRAFCMAAADGTESKPLHGSSKCATRGSKSDRKCSVPKRLPRTTLKERSATTSMSAARKLRPGTQKSPAQIVDNPKKRHAPVKKAVHRSDSRRSKSTAQRKVPPSAPRQDRENKPRASPARENKPRASPRTQGPSEDGTNSTKIYRKKKSGNSGTRSQGRASTTPPSTTSTDESMQNGTEACGNARSLAARPDLLQTARCSTNRDSPQFDRPGAGSHQLSVDDWDPFDEPWDKAESSFKSTGPCINAPIGPSDATSEDYDSLPAYEEVRAYVASASTTDVQAPLLECLEVTAANPTTGAARKGIVFFDPGSTFSYISSTLARDLNLPNRGKCVRRVHTFGCSVPTTVEGFSTSVVLGAPRGLQVSLAAISADFVIPSVRTALVDDSDLPALRRNERSVTPSQVTPDILIGQDRIHLFGRQQGSRLPAGYEVVHSIFGPTIGGAPQVATTPTPKAAHASLAEQGLGVPSLQATAHSCLQNELKGDATSTTLHAERHRLPGRMERSELLQRTPNPLDTALPLQPGPPTTTVVLQSELILGYQNSAERDQQLDRRLRTNTEQTTAPAQTILMLPDRPPRLSLDPPSHPVESALRALNIEPTNAAVRARVSPMSPDVLCKTTASSVLVSDHHTMTDAPIHNSAPSELSDSGAYKHSTDGHHLHHRRTTGQSMYSSNLADCTTAADSTEPSASRLGTLPVAGFTPAEAADMPTTHAQMIRPSASRSGPLPIADRTATEAPTTPKHPATQTKSTRSSLGPLPEMDLTAGHTASELAQAALDPAARADPLDQEDNTTCVAPIAAFRLDSSQDPASLATSTTRCTPAEASEPVSQPPMARRPQTEAARNRSESSAACLETTPDPAIDHLTSVARRAPAEATLEHVAAPDSATHVRRTNRRDSPLKNETVCFADESTFRHFGRLLRPEVLMIPTPVPSLEDALQSVYDYHPINEVGRVVFWFSDSDATPLSPAVQLRLVVELSRHYATHYPTVMQYVVATPSIGSRQDVWTCGLFKLQVEMQVLLPYARLIMRQRRGRSGAPIEVKSLKRYLRDHHHLNLWSHYDANTVRTVEASYSSPTPQQRRVRRDRTSADHPAAEVPDSARSRSRRRLLRITRPPTPIRSAGRLARTTSKGGTADADTHAGSSFLLGKKGSRRRDGLPDGSATQPIAQFPPPPSQSRFRSKPPVAHLRTESARTTCSTPLVAPAHSRKPKTRSRSQPASLAVRKTAITNSRGKMKEHPFRDEKLHRSKDNQAPVAPADTSTQPAKWKPSASRFGPLPIVDKTVAETAEHEDTDSRPRVCAFCNHPHCVAKCIFYRSRSQRIRRAKELGYCYICLRVGHTAQACPSGTPSPCLFCKQGHHHRALCRPATSATPGGSQQPPAPATDSNTTKRTPATKVTKKSCKPGRSAHSTDAPPAAKMPPPTPEPAEAHHRRKPRKRKDREPRT